MLEGCTNTVTLSIFGWVIIKDQKKRNPGTWSSETWKQFSHDSSDLGPFVTAKAEFCLDCSLAWEWLELLSSCWSSSAPWALRKTFVAHQGSFCLCAWVQWIYPHLYLLRHCMCKDCKMLTYPSKVGWRNTLDMCRRQILPIWDHS